MIVVATRNFRLVDELLQGSGNASFRALVVEWGDKPTREVLRYLASELNREYFQLWNIGQIVLGGVAALMLKRDAEHHRARILVVVALMLSAGMLVSLTPMIIRLGRSLDFVPREPPPAGLSRFWVLHVVYTVIECAKLVLLGLSAFWLARGPASLQAAEAEPAAS